MEVQKMKFSEIPQGATVATVAYVVKIENARVDLSTNKACYDVHLSDGDTVMPFILWDKRIETAKEHFLGKVVTVILKNTERPSISKIQVNNEISTAEFAPSGEQKKIDRLMISGVAQFMGRSCRIPVLITAMGPQKTSKNGKPYYSVSVTDGKDNASYQVWDAKLEENQQKYLNKVAYLTLDVSEFTKITRFELCSDIPLKEFVRTAPLDAEKMHSEIVSVLSSMECSMAPVAMKIYTENKEKLLRWSGAMKLHHSIHGGLLYHVYRMMHAAQCMSAIYPNIDSELLVIGTLLHDIGKLRELDTNELGISTFTVDGNLSGHVLMGIEMLNEAVSGMEEKPDAEAFRMVKHMIASHHGESAFGAIVSPATPEAIILHYLDMIDSRMYMVEEELKKVERGAVTEKVFGLNNTRLYKAQEMRLLEKPKPEEDDKSEE